MVQSTRPRLKVVGLHVEGLKALRRVDWPADGMAWGGQVPDLVMVGGVNGSGKTTLLELIAALGHTLLDWSRVPVLGGWNAWLDLAVTSAETGSTTFRVVAGDEDFAKLHRASDGIALHRQKHGYAPHSTGRTWGKAHSLLSNPKELSASDFPGIVYFPTDRQLVIPDEPYKAAGRLNGPLDFVHRFHAAEKWSESIEAVLYAARWSDLNAKEQGRPQDATHFESYSRAFQGFFGDTKRLVWTAQGELVVELANGGTSHSIDELSSGEKQALLFGAELHRRWRPGSVILIDEPELHFHPTWQTTLWTLLEQWQKERGGQVIVATQSNHLFSIANPGTTVLLGQALA